MLGGHARPLRLRRAVLRRVASQPLSTGWRRTEQRRGVGDPAEDPALGGDHLQADPLELREVRTDAVGQRRGTRSRGRWPPGRWCARTPRWSRR